MAVRLPAAVVEALELKEGDEIEITVTSKQDSKFARSRENALETIRRLAQPFPPGFKFDRDEANRR